MKFNLKDIGLGIIYAMVLVVFPFTIAPAIGLNYNIPSLYIGSILIIYYLCVFLFLKHNIDTARTG